MLTELTLPPRLAETLEERTGESAPSHWNPTEWEKTRAQFYNDAEGHLEGEYCPICKNKGSIMRVDEDGTHYFVRCSCMKKRKYAELARKSGLGDMIARYTLTNWKVERLWQEQMKSAVEQFAGRPQGWFYIAGRPGTGKTHLCTALCSRLLEKGMPVRYLVWRDFSVRAKACVTESEEYDALLRPYRGVKVLYIDDLFKSGRGKNPSEGDVNLAFELLNDRYNDSSLVTVISSEIPADGLLSIDEGLGSRIYERSRGNYYDLSNRENWRLTH